MFTQAIGATLPSGGAGTYSRQPDQVVITLPAGGSAAIPFGTPLKLSSGKVVAMGAGDTAAAFLGIAAAEFKSALALDSQAEGKYAVNDPVPVFQRGCIMAKCQKGTPALCGSVYLRITANASYPTAAVGGLEAEADGNNTILLNGVEWAGAKDANSNAELRLWGRVVYSA